MHVNAHTTNIDIKVPPDPTLTQRNHLHTDPATIPQSHNSAHSYWPSKTQQGTVAQRGDTAPTLLPGALLHPFPLFSYTLPSQALPVCFTSSRKFITFSLRTAFWSFIPVSLRPQWGLPMSVLSLDLLTSALSVSPSYLFIFIFSSFDISPLCFLFLLLFYPF